MSPKDNRDTKLSAGSGDPVRQTGHDERTSSGPIGQSHESPPQSPHVGMPAHHLRSYLPIMNEAQAPKSSWHEPGRYEIRLQGHLDSRWLAWFDGLSLTSEDDGTTVMRGPIVDQAALHGVLQKIRDLGLPLLSVTHDVTHVATTTIQPGAQP